MTYSISPEVPLMLTATSSAHLSKVASDEGSIDEQAWHDLYVWLLPLVEMWVRDSGVASWSGQYREISEDITLEAVMRTFRYSQRALQGEMPSVGSIKALGRVIARNYFRDWRKKDWCLVRTLQSSDSCDTFSSSRDLVDPSQIALDHLLLHSTFFTIAQVIARFPRGQRTALLSDLANLSDGDEQPSLLEQALLAVGLHLNDYKSTRPSDPSARGRDAALRSIAYKRLRNALHA